MGSPLLTRLKRGVDCASIGLDQWRAKRAPDARTRAEARRHLEERLGRLRGLPQKLGQILSMSSDEEKAESFATLTDGAPAMPLEEVLGLLSERWGVDPAGVIREIDPDGLAASLGQVHRALLHDGREVAIKVQYPMVRDAVEDDLRLLGWLSKPVGDLGRGFDLGSYQRVIAQGLEEELDYLLEAERGRTFSEAMGTLAVVPAVIEELTTHEVLVTTWEEGARISEVEAEWTEAEKQAAGRALLRLFFAQVFEHGLLHADPHSGNYRFRRSAAGEVEVVLYDYGCVRELESGERLALLRLILESSGESSADPYPLFVHMGFDAGLLEPIRGKLPALCKVLFAPFATPGAFDVATWELGSRVDDILGSDRWNFRISGAAQSIFLMRAFHGLIWYLGRLACPVSFSAALSSHAAALGAAAASLELQVQEDPTTSFAGLARHLCLQVQEGDEEKARITLPASAVERLETLLDEDLAERIAQRGIELHELVSEARRRCYSPQQLFELQDGPKRVRVWLS
jgi:hypothetical protein